MSGEGKCRFVSLFNFSPWKELSVPVRRTGDKSCPATRRRGPTLDEQPSPRASLPPWGNGARPHLAGSVPPLSRHLGLLGMGSGRPTTLTPGPIRVSGVGSCCCWRHGDIHSFYHVAQILSSHQIGLKTKEMRNEKRPFLLCNSQLSFTLLCSEINKFHPKIIKEIAAFRCSLKSHQLNFTDDHAVLKSIL